MSVEFGFVWGWTLLPLPLLAARLLPPARFDQAALWVPFFAGTPTGRTRTSAPRGARRRILLAWVMLVAALSQPTLSLGGDAWTLYRGLLVIAILAGFSAGLARTRRPRATRRLADHYYRESGS